MSRNGSLTHHCSISDNLHYADDFLRHADNGIGILAYAMLELWNILLVGAGGPVAAAVGAHRTGNPTTTELLSKSFGISTTAALMVSLSVTFGRTLLGSFLHWVVSLARTSSKVRRTRRMVIDREEYVSTQVFGSGNYSSETRKKHANFNVELPDFFGGPILSSILVILLVLAVIAIWVGYLCGIAAAVAALCTKLFNEQGTLHNEAMDEN